MPHSLTGTLQCNGTPIHLGLSAAALIPSLPSRTVVITDEHLERLHGAVTEGLPRVVLPPGEEAKSLATVERICGELVALGADRGTHLLAVGGGVVCDITGLVASVFMRGVSFSLMPTTLLAQTDAAIGGKTGVNSGPYKNLIGTFARPEAVFCDPSFLVTLPDEELSNGLAECIKHACIADSAFFDFLENGMERILEREPETLRQLIATSAGIKASVVNRDPKEGDVRRLLNYGHTYGHAMEKMLGMPHGQAVSLGICVVNEMAVSEGFLSRNDADRVAQLLARAHLPTDISTLDMPQLRKLLIGDKKRSGQKLAFVLLRGIGNAFIHLADVEH